MEEVAVSTQMGSALNNGSCDILHLRVRSLTMLAEIRKLSLGLIFLDFSIVFTSMERSIAATALGIADHLFDWLQASEFHPDIIEQVQYAIASFKIR